MLIFHLGMVQIKRGGMGREMREFQERGDICTPLAVMLMFGRNQHNSVKHLSFN